MLLGGVGDLIKREGGTGKQGSTATFYWIHRKQVYYVRRETQVR